MVFVLFGPGGAGKGTVAARLASRLGGLRLSRSWTTRAPRSGEAPDAYVFVDRAEFEARAAAGDFFEWVEFLGNLYGTPVPDPDEPGDLLLEIDLQGARQVRRQRPDATLILLAPPSPDAQRQRLEARGDAERHIAARLAAGPEEERAGREIADAVVVNHDVDQAVDEVADIVERRRSHFRGGGHGPGRAAVEPGRGAQRHLPASDGPEGS